MSQDGNPEEVTIFHDSATLDSSAYSTIENSAVAAVDEPWQTQEEQLAVGQPTGAEVGSTAMVMDSVNAEYNQSAPQPSSSSQTPLTVEYVKLRPSTALLILRLLGLGLCILFFLFLIGVFSDLMVAIFPSYSPLIDNRYVLLLTGVIFYMIFGWVLYEQWSHMLYTVYRDRILVEQGWILRNKRTLDINQFGGALVEQGVFGKIFQYGSIRLLFNGAIGKLAGEQISDIADPFENYQMMMRLIGDQA